jgi:cell shape-determining protein MreC
MKADEARRLKELESENAQLKKLLADAKHGLERTDSLKPDIATAIRQFCRVRQKPQSSLFRNA